MTLLLVAAEPTQINIDGAALITSAITLAGAISGAILKGASMMVTYLKERDNKHQEVMLQSMRDMMTMQRDSVIVMERITSTVAQLRDDMEDRFHHTEEVKTSGS